jgi:hypothetical protein
VAHEWLQVDHPVAVSPPDGGVAAGHQCADAGTVQEGHPPQVDDDVDRVWHAQRVLDGGAQCTGAAQIDLARRSQRDAPAGAFASGQ